MTDSPVTLITGGSSWSVMVDRDRYERRSAAAFPDAAHDPEGSLSFFDHDVSGSWKGVGCAPAGAYMCRRGGPGICITLTNVLGPALLIRAAVPALRCTCGRIVLVGSAVGVTFSRGNFYSATKWALTGLAENTRLLRADDGIGGHAGQSRPGGDPVLGSARRILGGRCCRPGRSPAPSPGRRPRTVRAENDRPAAGAARLTRHFW
jgi:short subunit dehydrogenase